jgi:phosphotriesterase-related protein
MESLIETRNSEKNVRAGFIKVACEMTLKESPLKYMEAAATVANVTGALIEIHTEKGADVDNILNFFLKQGVSPHQLIFCHMDKRPDFILHSELAKEGVGLEYDTFYRPKYLPEENLWPLIEHICNSGLESSVVLATDMAEYILWKEMGSGPGLTGFITQIGSRLQSMGFEEDIINGLMGQNIANRLAFLDNQYI